MERLMILSHSEQKTNFQILVTGQGRASAVQELRSSLQGTVPHGQRALRALVGGATGQLG